MGEVSRRPKNYTSTMPLYQTSRTKKINFRSRLPGKRQYRRCKIPRRSDAHECLYFKRKRRRRYPQTEIGFASVFSPDVTSQFMLSAERQDRCNVLAMPMLPRAVTRTQKLSIERKRKKM